MGGRVKGWWWGKRRGAGWREIVGRVGSVMVEGGRGDGRMTSRRGLFVPVAERSVFSMRASLNDNAPSSAAHPTCPRRRLYR